MAEGILNPLGVGAARQAEMLKELGPLPPGAPEVPFGLGASVISPDDKTLYVVVRDRGIIAFDLLTNQYRDVWKVTTPDTVIFELAVSPDGRTFVLTTGKQMGFIGPLVRVATDGTGYRELYPSAFRSPVAWSTDGRFILFLGDSQQRTQLLRISADGGRRAQPAGSVINQVGHRISFNPDGSRVVFSAGTRGAELWVLDNLSSLLKSR